MNILIPDSWLREYLKTKATPKQIKEYLSLCGPSVERITTVDGETVYDIEITGNRPDAMSVVGVAREASVILPRFGVAAALTHDPYHQPKIPVKKSSRFALNIKTDETLNPRFTVVVIQIKNQPSPKWLAQWLTACGMRPINAVVDVTNYLMKAYGQPVHAFDFDQILPDKHGMPTMYLRASQKGETIVTLDGKSHTLPGGDIVMEDGSGRLIDLCGIMGGGVSHITDSTSRIVLFVQTYDPAHVRKTSMALAHRTDAAALFEKSLDSELVMPTMLKGIELIEKLAGGAVASQLYDIYPTPYTPATVFVARTKVDSYIGVHLSDKEIKDTLLPLGFRPTVSKHDVSVLVPSWRRDVTIDVDIIEEIARIYGYHHIRDVLPQTEPPMVFEDPTLGVERELKKQLRDWGYTETYTYSMISEKLMDIFHLAKDSAYQISNPLSDEWVYMRTTLLPSMLTAVKENLSHTPDLSLFELSMVYEYRKKNIPRERPMLLVAKTGHAFSQLKGLSETILSQFGIPYPNELKHGSHYFHPERSLMLGKYGCVGEVHPELLKKLGINDPVTILELAIDTLMEFRKTEKTYIPIPKYPASFEDLAFIVPQGFPVGPLINAIKSIDPLISDVTLLDSYQQVRTLHITYQSQTSNLTGEDISPIRQKILSAMESKYQVFLKTV